MFRRTKKVLKGMYKTLKVAALTASVIRAGLWIYEKTKSEEAKPETKPKPAKKRKAKKVKVK